MHSMTMRQESWREKYRIIDFFRSFMNLMTGKNGIKKNAGKRQILALVRLNLTIISANVQKQKLILHSNQQVLVKDLILSRQQKLHGFGGKILIMKSELEIKNFVMELAGLMQLIVWI